MISVGSLIVGSALSIALYTSAAYAGSKAETDRTSVFPAGWTVPTGWHVDRSVKTAVAEGDLTGTGAKTRAVLMSNGTAIRLMIFVNCDSPKIEAYDSFDWREDDLKSDEGLKIFSPKVFELEAGQPNTCGMKDIECTPDKRIIFHPKISVLWITLGDWGGEVFHWADYAKGFQGLSSGD